MNILRYFILLIFLVSNQILAQNTIQERIDKLNNPKDFVQFQDGIDYFSYEEAIKIPERKDKRVPILFFFDYDCRLCSLAHDFIFLYSQINQEKIVLEEYPLATNDNFLSANIFLSLQLLNKHNVSDLLLFETAEKKRYVELSEYDNLTNWLKTKDVDIQKFNELFHSLEIKQKIKEIIQLTENYGIFTYPYVIIDGKYVLTASTLYNDDYTFAVLDFLLKKIQQEKIQRGKTQ